MKQSLLTAAMVPVMGLGLIFGAATLEAGNDPSIRGYLRSGTQKAMQRHIRKNMVRGRYIIFDGQTGKLLRLKFKKLHKGIVRKGDMFVSCADFTDKRGRKYDLDFLVARQGRRLKVVQGLIHSVNKQKRRYQVEN